MVRVGFLVEGASEAVLINSIGFKNWARDNGIDVVKVIDAKGGGNICGTKVNANLNRLLEINPDYVVALLDLDHHPCITTLKQKIKGCIADPSRLDLIFVARKAIESWFLADTEAMREILGDLGFYCPAPEAVTGRPYDMIQSLFIAKKGRGCGDHLSLAKDMNYIGFDLSRAAAHPNCPSARYFIDRLRALPPSKVPGVCHV